ncbi:MAG: PadR family transcriptional regulator [Gemmatimonadota bacterium]
MGPRNDDWFGAWASFCGPGFTGFSRRGGRGRRGHGRVFERGDLKYMVLALLEEKAMHGYEVMQRLEDESGGYYSASPGSVYPVLQMLQDQGYVDSEEVEGKRVYRITESGRAFLDEHRDRAEDVADRVSDFAERFTGRAMRDVTRSFVRLAQTSFDRAVRYASRDPEAMSELQEILDRTADEIEAWSQRNRTRRRSGSGSAGSAEA